MFKIGLLFLYCLIVTGGTYAYLYFGDMDDSTLVGKGYCNNIYYDGIDINASDLISTVNYEEGAQTTITLSYPRDCEIYTLANIYIHTNDTTTAPIATTPALRYKVFEESTLISEGLVNAMGDVLLATVPLSIVPKSYTIYLWIDSDLSNGMYHDTTYSGYIYATSEQTSTLNNFLIRDLSYHTNNAVAYHEVVWDKESGTVTTNGVDNYIDCGLENYDFGNTVTMVARVKFNELTSSRLQEFFNNFEYGGFGMYVDGSNLKGQYYISGQYVRVTSSSALVTNTWYTLVTTYDGNVMKLYINGVLDDTLNIVGTIGISTMPLYIGANPNPDGSLYNRANITLSDALVFNRVLSAEEIAYNYSGEILESRVDKTDLLLYYNFEDTSRDNMIMDLSENGNTGIVYGATWDKDNGIITTDGVDDYIDCGLENYDFGNTISLVVRFQYLSNNNVENELLVNYEGGGVGLSIDTSDKPFFQIYTTGYNRVSSDSALNFGEWYILVGTYDGSTLKLYLNGTQVGSFALTGNIQTVSAPFHLGSNPTWEGNPTTFSNVTYSDALVFDRTLSQEEITTTYSNKDQKINSSSIDRTDLLLYYDFQ